MIRERLLRQVAPLAKKLGDDIIALLVPQLEHAVERAVADAKTKLAADLEAVTALAPAPKSIAKPKRRKKRSPRSVGASAGSPRKRKCSSSSRASVPARAVPGPKSTAPSGSHRSVCSVCQEFGHNARTCPKRQAATLKPPVVASRSAAMVDPPAPRLSTAERTALDKPCRDPNCRIVRLHAAHGEGA